ncbi:MAG: hypothetical protein N2C14_03580 [Planctomycetales bacterium]
MLSELISLFYDSPEDLGELEQTPREDVPEPYRRLLAHEHHMTVTVEDFHQSLVDVQVVGKNVSDSHYARKILLTRQADGAVVQFGIMRVNLYYLSPAVRDEIVKEETPLGRILINHNVLRSIRLFDVWKVEPGPDLQALFHLESPETTYGRTAVIDCNNVPAVELLEIVAPTEK